MTSTPMLMGRKVRHIVVFRPINMAGAVKVGPGARDGVTSGG
jgi:hypothetical protein